MQNKPFQFWVHFIAILAISSFLIFFQLGYWPWDHDEVPCLIELGLIDSVLAKDNLGSQINRLPKLIPVWYGTQSLFLSFLPHNELGTRILSALCGVLTVLTAFVLAWFWKGKRFAVFLAILLSLNQSFVWLTQQNRFYSMALLFLTLSFASLWWQTKWNNLALICCATTSLLAILSHNLLVVVFGIGFIATAICFSVGCVSGRLFCRSSIMAGISIITYFIYLRPIMTGWISGGTGGTNTLVSFIANLGVPSFALAWLGIGFSTRTKLPAWDLLWWTVFLFGCVLFIFLNPMFLKNWNPRYALLFMPPFFLLAAYGAEQIAIKLQFSWQRAVWLSFVVMLLIPKLASHYQDGSRHDFRTSAQIICNYIGGNEKVYCNWPFTMEYYLKHLMDNNVQSWPFNGTLPEDEFLLVFASNAYSPIIKLAGRHCDVIGEVYSRRFDEQSHVVRICKVSAKVKNN